MAADFFTTEVWTARGLVTYYIVFVLELHSRRVQVIGCTPYPDEAFVIQCLRQVTGEPSGLLRGGRILLCDRDPEWSRAVEQWLGTAGIRVVRTPPRAPNCSAYAERFVRSVKEECLDHVVPNRRTALASDGSRVCDALPSGAQSPRTGERADRATCRATPDRRDSPTSASWRDSQLLLPVSGVVRSSLSVGQNGFGRKPCANTSLCVAPIQIAE